ncbi:MAG TPA: OmpA family protein [Holophagaceae bacterium]|nr:OmpA family protein [Holophagaceae bacterium]
MRTSILGTCLIAAALTVPLQAQSPFSWGRGEVGALIQHNSDCVKQAPGWGLGLGHWYDSRWGAEATFVHGQIESKNAGWKAKEDHLDASLLFRPVPAWGAWIPFLRLGAGVSRLQSPLSLEASDLNRANLMLGAGAQVLVGTHGLGTVEVRSATVDSSKTRQETQVMVGYGWRWGARPAPKAAPAVIPVPPPTPAPAPAPVAPQPPPPEPPKAPEPAPVVAPAPAPVPAPLPKKIVLGEAVLHFPNNGDALGEDAVKAIQAVAEQLKAYPGEYSLVVGGHTSSLGAKAHNKALSFRRAQSVAKVLVAAGIPGAKVSAVGFGPDQPVADNATKEGQGRNRRVEIDVKTADAVEKVRTDTRTVDGDVAKPAKPVKKGKKGN